MAGVKMRRGWTIAIGLVITIAALSLGVDADRDGHANGREWAVGSAAFDPDTDQDGLCDGGGARNCLDPITLEPYGRGEEEYWSGVFYDDTDSDGIPDVEEVRLALAHEKPFDPRIAIRSPDSDGDGLEDGSERASGTDLYSADTDGDGLSDAEEVWSVHGQNYVSNATVADTDGDGLLDGEEITRYFTRATEADSDGDGLSDADEVKLGSDPLLEDSDRDRMADGWEVRYLLDPTRPEPEMDRDGDGLKDLTEWSVGTNPLSADTDNDTMSDSWEYLGGTDPIVPDSSADADSDELNNTMEYWAGTSPLEPDSDGDGLRDGEEVRVRGDLESGFVELTNPMRHDTDDDIMSDAAEHAYWLAREGLATASNATVDQLRRLAYRLNTPDSDGDGLLDGDEINALATDPASIDTDSDGVADGEEIWRCHSDPYVPAGCSRVGDSADRDADGVPDAIETAYWGPNRANVDLDGDGLGNLDDPDSDGDGLGDGVEILQISLPREFFYHTSAARNDTDGDTLADSEEASNRLTPHKSECARLPGSEEASDDPAWDAMWTRTEDGCWYVEGAWGIRLYAA